MLKSIGDGADRYRNLILESVYQTVDEGRLRTEWTCTSGDIYVNIKYVLGILFIATGETEYESKDYIVIATDKKIAAGNKDFHTNNKIYFKEIVEFLNIQVDECQILD